MEAVMFRALESHYFSNVPGPCSYAFPHCISSLCLSRVSVQSSEALMANSSAFRAVWEKGTALCLGWRRGGQDWGSVRLYLHSTEPKCNLMGQICKFTPANPAFLGFSCASILSGPQRAACTCSISWDGQLRSLGSLISVVRNTSTGLF